jgi:hypothetical protein
MRVVPQRARDGAEGPFFRRDGKPPAAVASAPGCPLLPATQGQGAREGVPGRRLRAPHPAAAAAGRLSLQARDTAGRAGPAASPRRAAAASPPCPRRVRRGSAAAAAVAAVRAPLLSVADFRHQSSESSLRPCVHAASAASSPPGRGRTCRPPARGKGAWLLPGPAGKLGEHRSSALAAAQVGGVLRWRWPAAASRSPRAAPPRLMACRSAAAASSAAGGIMIR